MNTFTGQISNVKFAGAIIPRWSLVLVLCLGWFMATGSVTVAGNRCKDHCNDTYHLRKDVCREIPLKHERKSCESAAKHAKDNCKHHCR